MAEVASAYVSLIPSAKGFATGVTKETDAAARTAGKRFGGIFSGSLKSVIGGALAGIGVTRLLSDSLGEAREAQKVGALTTQVIKSTGGAAHVTAEQVGDLATAISKKVGIDDEAIQSGENLLLTFKNVRNEAGKGNKIFDQATRSVVDMAAAMAAASGGQIDFRSATTLVGKALNDPIKGLTALSRVGVTFTEGQKKQITALVESGKQMDAQKVILKELKSEFGGAARAQATEADKAQVAIGNLKEQIGTALLPVVDDLAQRVSEDVVPAISEFITQMQDGTGAGGEVVDVLSDIVDVGKGVFKFFDSLPGPVKKYGVELAIAAVALNKVNNALVAGRTNITGWLNSLGPAEKTMSRTAKTSYALGVGIRNLAGAGGMVALTQSTNDASLASVGLKRTLGGAAAGFAVGGPVGAAFGFLGGAAWTLKDALKQGAHEAKVAIPSYKEYSQTLAGVAANTTKATREMVLQRLESSGLLDATRKLGLTDRQAINAMLGNVGARKQLALALRASKGLTDAQRTALEQETGAVGASRLAQLKHNIAIAQGKDELKKARQALKDFMKEPASKRVSITGVEAATAQLKALSRGLREALGLTKDLNTAGPGGIDVLLSGPIKKRARGGPVIAGQPYVVGETRPELFVPRVSGTIVPKVPATSAVMSSIEAEQASYRAFSRALAANQVVIMRRPDLDDLELLVGAG